MSYNENVRKMHQAALAALKQISGEDLEQAIAEQSTGQQSANPRQVLTDLVAVEIWEGRSYGFDKVEGTFNSQAHTWFEYVEVNREIDPLPRRTIIDVAPVGTVPSPVVYLPESPVLMLYRRKK